MDNVHEMQSMEQRGERPEMWEMQKPTDENGNELKDSPSDLNEKMNSNQANEDIS